jgi:hypothetical protein
LKRLVVDSDRLAAYMQRHTRNAWKKWYARQRDRIAFVESACFRWLESPEVLEYEVAAKAEARSDGSDV